MQMDAANTVNTLFRHLLVKGSAARRDNGLFQGVMVCLHVRASAYNDDGGEYSAFCRSYLLASSRGRSYIAVFGAAESGPDNCWIYPTEVPEESWQFLADHDSCWTEGVTDYIRKLVEKLKSGCPAPLKDELRVEASLGDKPFYIVAADCSGETVSKLQIT
ncbi:MAG TPA: hypothetical protein VHP58_04890 [Alphaproteobacteria bacterium]|nr:hypothetical protein [Alphaproteobacteria bacterium]